MTLSSWIIRVGMVSDIPLGSGKMNSQVILKCLGWKGLENRQREAQA